MHENRGQLDRTPCALSKCTGSQTAPLSLGKETALKLEEFQTSKQNIDGMGPTIRLVSFDCRCRLATEITSRRSGKMARFA